MERAATARAQGAPLEALPQARRVGYLCGSPRVSTRPDTEAAGPRAHVVGVMRAFAALGWDVHPFIVGDRMPSSWTGAGSERRMTASSARALAADLVRLGLRVRNRRKAWSDLRGEVDMVYERYAAFQDLGARFRRRGVPWILETNGPFFYEAATDRKSMVLTQLAERKEAKAYRACDVLVCISDALKEIILDRVGIPAEKILVVPNGVDVNVFDPAGFPAAAPGGRLRIGFVGHLIEWQGLDVVIRLLPELRAAGAAIELNVVGDGPMLEPWRRLAHDMGVSELVSFAGRVPASEVPARIATFDVGFSSTAPSGLGRNYRSPLKLYEYMAMARPVVSSRCEDSERTVTDGLTGFLFDAGDPTNIREALLRAWNGREQLAAMGARARREMVEHHSWEARVVQMIRGIDAILARR